MWARGREPRRALWVEHLQNTPVVLLKGMSDPRVTSRLAAILRRYSLDELPQLWHVVSGTMALAGPRPLTREELDEHYGLDQLEVLRVKPGLTGLWQVYGRSRVPFDDAIAMDRLYVLTRSWWGDMLLLWRTVRVVIFGVGGK